MLKTLQREDRILLNLINSSILTKAQVDTLLCEIEGIRKAEKLRERASRRDRENITIGAYLRTKKQAYYRINKVLRTILLLSYMGIFTQEKLIALLKVAEILSKVKETKLTTEQSSKILQHIEETLKRCFVISQ